MGRTPCCEKNGLKKGPWTPEEDQKLVDYIHKHGYGNWRTLPKNAGLQRCGKSCRLRWTNYLRPDIKRGRFSFEEEEIIIQLHRILGNKWSAIASRLPGRTDNEIKNYWNTHIRKRLLRMGIDPMTHAPRLDLLDLSSILTATSLYGMHHHHHREQDEVMNPELLKLATSLFSSNHNNNNNMSAQNYQQNQVPLEHSVQEQESNCAISLPNYNFTQTIESNYSVGPYASISHGTSSDWQYEYDVEANGIACSTPYDVTNNYHCYYYHQNLVDPPPLLSSETSNFQYSNNSSSSNNNKLGFAATAAPTTSVLSTPSSSPKPLNSGSTYVNGSTTEDDREISYVTTTNNYDMFKFQIPHLFDM